MTFMSSIVRGNDRRFSQNKSMVGAGGNAMVEKERDQCVCGSVVS
jgi:hypothetical protein